MAEDKTPKDINPKLGLAYMMLVDHLKVYQFTTKVLAGAVIFLAIVTFTLLLSNDKEVVYIELAKSSDIRARIVPEPLTKNMKELLVRQQIRDYVYNRTQIDNITESYRFSKVYSMNTPDENERFQSEYRRIQKESSFDRRDVKIVTDSPMSQGMHLVELETIDYFKNEKFKNYWSVTLRYEFRKQKVIVNNETKNPLGLTGQNTCA
jgi:Type IV secretory pathway, component VirB8